MPWESSRPVPWRRLIREWLIYAAIMAAVFAVYAAVAGDANLVGAAAGLLISGPLYLGLGVVLAKLGHERKSVKQLRAERVDRAGGTANPAVSGTSRQRPAPTRRTSGGGSNRSGKQRR